ncbi:MAG: sodium:alanine symporter family protein [Bacteroidaceae bacterium]|nr:sodium:alanine symporter family protein [Bacteroidaceae bacterium]
MNFDELRLWIETLFEEFNVWVQSINDIIWGWPMLLVLLGTHLFLTFKLRFPQRYTFKAIRLSVKSEKGAEGDVSPYAALVTTLAGTIGTGNIVGVASALVIGGPGALLWCLLTGVLGIATKYAESLMALKYRVKRKDGSVSGGPMYVLSRAMNLKSLAIVFCVFTLIMGFSAGNFIQCNAIAETLKEAYDVDIYLTATVLTIAVCSVIFFGLKGISRVCEGLVPLMTIVYLIGCIASLVINYQYIWQACVLIVKSAFNPVAIGGGAVGGMMISLQYGVSRGLLSNESGMGSAAIIAAAAKSRNPVRLALISSTTTFWDTVVVCTLTGIVAVSSMLAIGFDWSDTSNGMVMQKAFEQIPSIGSHLLTIITFTFAFSTVLGWTYCGEKSIEFIYGKSSAKAVRNFRILWVIATFIGAIMPLQLVWNLGTTAAAFMIIPNVIPLFILSKQLVRDTRYYLWEDRLDEVAKEDLPEV